MSHDVITRSDKLHQSVTLCYSFFTIGQTLIVDLLLRLTQEDMTWSDHERIIIIHPWSDNHGCVKIMLKDRDFPCTWYDCYTIRLHIIYFTFMSHDVKKGLP